MKLYTVTVEFETMREAQVVITAAYLAKTPAAARKAAIAYVNDNYDVAPWAPATITGGAEFVSSFEPVRFAILKDDGWREAETNRPLVHVPA